MSSNGRVIVFDTREVAKNFLPMLGGGRPTTWKADGESCYWLPVEKNALSRACVVTGYDPYDAPAGIPGIRSEAHGMEWRCHIMWSHWYSDCGQFEACSDGTFANTALGEEVY